MGTVPILINSTHRKEVNTQMKESHSDIPDRKWLASGGEADDALTAKWLAEDEVKRAEREAEIEAEREREIQFLLKEKRDREGYLEPAEEDGRDN